MRVAFISTAALSSIAIAVSGVVAPVSATPADAAGAWSNVRPVSNQEMFGTFGLAPDGYAVAETMSHLPMGCGDPGASCDTSAYVDLAEREAGGAWADVRLPGAGIPFTVDFDADSNGWALSYRSDSSVVVSARPAGGSWSPGEVLPWPASLTGNVAVHLLLTDSGTPYVWFVAADGSGTSLHLATRTASGWSTSSRAVGPVLDLTAGADGTIRAAWVQAIGDGRNAIVVADLHPDGTWGPDTTVAEVPGSVAKIEWAGPRALLLHEELFSGDLRVLGQSTDGSWTSDVTDLGAARGIETSTGGEGTIVAWDAADAIRVTELRADGTWSRPAEPSTSGALEAVQIDVRGNATLVWQDLRLRPDLHYTRRPVNGVWTKSRLLPEPVGSTDWNGGVVVGADARGTVTVGAAADPSHGYELYTADLSTPVAVTAVDRTPDGGWALAPSFRVGWSTTWVRATSHDVRYTVRRITGGAAKLHRLATGTHGDQKTLHGKPGRVYCLSARAHAGTTTGPWGSATCVATPLDDRALAAGPGWKRAGGTSVARMRGATLTSPRITGTRFALRVRPSNDAGTVRVRLGRHPLGTYRLAKGEPGQRRVIQLGDFRHIHGGRLHVTVVSSGKPVRIDGVYAR